MQRRETKRHTAAQGRSTPAKPLPQRLIHGLIPVADAGLHPHQRSLKVAHVHAGGQGCSGPFCRPCLLRYQCLLQQLSV